MDCFGFAEIVLGCMKILVLKKSMRVLLTVLGVSMLDFKDRFLQEELKKAESQLQKNQILTQNFQEWWKKHGVDQKNDDKVQKLHDFHEKSQLSAKERKKRGLSGSDLDPNHSHFIFADDGSINNFGIEIKLRADIESCVAGNFRGVGVSKAGTGGKILQRVDDGIVKDISDMKHGNVARDLAMCCNGDVKTEKCFDTVQAGKIPTLLVCPRVTRNKTRIASMWCGVAT